MRTPWDLTALANAADPKASQAERHLWLVRLVEWLRHAPRAAVAPQPNADAPDDRAEDRTPLPALRLRHLVNQLERQDGLRDRVRGLAQAFWRDIDAAWSLVTKIFAYTIHSMAAHHRQMCHTHAATMCFVNNRDAIN